MSSDAPASSELADGAITATPHDGKGKVMNLPRARAVHRSRAE